jgi:tRNA-dihydrouridine synthase B
MYQLKPFKIGKVTIDPPLISAPMAGITHSPVRQLIASYGKPGLFFTEMLSAKHLPHDLRENSRWIQRSAVESPMAYQIFASTAEEAAIGCREILKKDPEIIDLNMACPAPSIATFKRAGAFLLSDLCLVEEMLLAMKKEIDRPLTVKIRLGKKPDLKFLQELTSILESCGVEAVTLHPRLTTEKLKRRARWEYIGYLKDMTNMAVIGNGDVKTREDCLKMFAQTGCDGVMIGRAAIQKPWLFSEICGAEIEINKEFLQEVYQKAVDLISGFFKVEQAIGRIKEFSWYFSKNLKFGHRYASRMQSTKGMNNLLDFIATNFERAI